VLQQRPYTFAQTNLSQSFFACDKAADHTFRLADHAGVIARRLESKCRVCQIDAKRGSWVYNADR
jgi:hypothetical protein